MSSEDQPTELMTSEAVQALCNAHRPDEATDTDWLGKVVKIVASKIPERAARMRAAREEVAHAESALLKKTNRFLREWASTGQWPIDWMDLRNHPIALSKGHKVRLGATSGEHIALAIQFQTDQFALQERTHNELVGALVKLRSMMSGAKARTADDLFKVDNEGAA